jgi:hypothetical protein
MTASFDTVPGPIDRDVSSDEGFKTAAEDITMKFYIASYSGSVSDGMKYLKWGTEVGLYLLYPELRPVIDRYPFRTLDFRLTNGDRLRIYDIPQNRSRTMEIPKGKALAIAQGWPL